MLIQLFLNGIMFLFGFKCTNLVLKKCPEDRTAKMYLLTIRSVRFFRFNTFNEHEGWASNQWSGTD